MVFGKKKKEDKTQSDQDKQKLAELVGEEPKQNEAQQEQQINLNKVSEYDVHIYNLLVLITQQLDKQTKLLEEILSAAQSDE